MNDRKIIVVIDSKGEVQVEAIGHRGGSCTKATDPLIKTLIGESADEQKKPEFYQGDIPSKVNEYFERHSE